MKGPSVVKQILASLGRGSLAVYVLTLLAILLIPLSYVQDTEWLKGLAFGLSFIGVATLLVLLLTRMTQQILSVRRAVKQAYDRQLTLANYLDRRVKENLDVASKGVVHSTSSTEVGNNAQHGYGADFEYAHRVERGQGALHTFALASRSLKIRDSLALGATSGRWREKDLLQFFRLVSANHLKESDRANHNRYLDCRNLQRFAGVLLNQQRRVTDLSDAQLIYRYVAERWGHRSMPRYDRYMAVEAAMANGDYKDVGPTFRQFGLSSDVLQQRLFRANGFVFEDLSPEALDGWLSSVNEIFESEGLAQISLLGEEAEGKLSVYDRLDSTANYSIAEGPKVTILMPSFNADARIYTAIRSLLKQTWQNFEILIIDDGSPEGTSELLERVAELDSRIKLHFLGRNRGAYVARNVGLEHASGDYITVHDDDDWSHPQKIELQVKDLLANREKVANGSMHIRTTEELLFTRLNNNPVVTQFNFSSVMFHKSLVDKIGGWNMVNRSGDSEYKDRIQAYSGQPILSPVEAPMSFTRTGGVSLTQGEMSRGYIDSSRRFYMHVYQANHRVAEEAANWSPASMELPIGVPENLKDGQRSTVFGHFDTIYATDFRFPGGNSSLAVAELKAMIDAGRRVGIIQLDSPVNSPGTPIARNVLALLQESGDKISVLSLLDKVSADLVLVRNPSVAQFVDQLETRIVAKNIALIVNSTPVLSDGTGQVYDLQDVYQNLEKLFGLAPKVIAESLITKSLATLLGDGDLFDDGVWPGLIDSDRFRFVSRSPDADRKPVIGRHSRDNKLKWPETAEGFRRVYVQPQRFETRILGGLSEVENMLEQSDLDAMEIYEFGALEPEVFLEGLDFWVYFTSKRLQESFGMGVAEAMSSGLVVILPENMRTTFGEGAVYCQASEVAETIERYWSSPELYQEQALRAREVALNRFSAAATLARIDGYASGRAEGGTSDTIPEV